MRVAAHWSARSPGVFCKANLLSSAVGGPESLAGIVKTVTVIINTVHRSLVPSHGTGQRKNPHLPGPVTLGNYFSDLGLIGCKMHIIILWAAGRGSGVWSMKKSPELVRCCQRCKGLMLPGSSYHVRSFPKCFADTNYKSPRKWKCRRLKVFARVTQKKGPNVTSESRSVSFQNPCHQTAGAMLMLRCIGEHVTFLSTYPLPQHGTVLQKASVPLFNSSAPEIPSRLVA